MKYTEVIICHHWDDGRLQDEINQELERIAELNSFELVEIKWAMGYNHDTATMKYSALIIYSYISD